MKALPAGGKEISLDINKQVTKFICANYAITPEVSVSLMALNPTVT